MSFLSPLFLAGMLAAAIPIAIHLFHRRTEPVIAFAAMRFLRRAPVEQASRRRMKELILLALRVSALLLLALAFARPYLPQPAAALAAPATLVLVDTSASLSAPGQFERARALARDAIAATPPTHAVAVMTFSRSADVVAPLSSDRAGARAAIERLQPGAGATRYAAVLGRAAELMGQRPGRIVLITDLQQSGWDAADAGSVPDSIALEVRGVDAPAGNVAVMSLRTQGDEAVAVVRNFGAAAVREQVAFALDGKPAGAVAVAVAPGASAEARFAVSGFSRKGTRTLTATVTDRLGYAADNARHAVLDADAAPAVLAVTPSGHASEAFYLERALAVGEGASGFRFSAVGGPQFAGLGAEALGDVDVVAILGTRGLDARGRDRLAAYVRGGGGLLLTAGPDVDPAVLQGALHDLVKTTWASRDAVSLGFAPDDGRHPVFRLFGGVGTLGNVTFTRAAALSAPPGAAVVARYSDGSPALVEEQVGDGRVLVFASDLNHRWNDFPLQPAFVPFMHETLRYLAAAQRPRAEYLVGDIPGSAGLAAGVVQRSGRRVAVNVDTRESDPAAVTADAFGAGVARLKVAAAQRVTSDTRDREDGQRLWQFALLAMVASLAAEGVIGRRLG